MQAPAAVLFDAYGTLFDVWSVGAQLEAWAPGRGREAALLLREKQIEYTRLVSGSDPSPGGSRWYEPFYDLTARALRYTSKRLDLGLSEAQAGALMTFYLRLPAFPECRAVLSELKARGLMLGILSNGDPPMLEAAAEASGLSPLLGHLISIDAVRQYKTHPAAYAEGTRRLGLEARDVLFVSCNAWDAVGAKWFGYRTFWVNRQGLPFEAIGDPPDHEGADLAALLEICRV